MGKSWWVEGICDQMFMKALFRDKKQKSLDNKKGRSAL